MTTYKATIIHPSISSARSVSSDTLIDAMRQSDSEFEQPDYEIVIRNDGGALVASRLVSDALWLMCESGYERLAGSDMGHAIATGMDGRYRIFGTGGNFVRTTEGGIFETRDRAIAIEALRYLSQGGPRRTGSHRMKSLFGVFA